MIRYKNGKKLIERPEESVFLCKAGETKSGSSTRTTSPVACDHILDYEKGDEGNIRPSSWDESDEDSLVKFTHKNVGILHFHSPTVKNQEIQKSSKEIFLVAFEKEDIGTTLSGTNRRQSPARVRRRTRCSSSSSSQEENNILPSSSKNEYLPNKQNAEDEEIFGDTKRKAFSPNNGFLKANLNRFIPVARMPEEKIINSETQDLEPKAGNFEENDDDYCRTFRKLSQILEIDEIKRDPEDIGLPSAVGQINKKCLKTKKEDKSSNYDKDAENYLKLSNLSSSYEKPIEINHLNNSAMIPGKSFNFENSISPVVGKTLNKDLRETKILFDFNYDDSVKNKNDKTNNIITTSNYKMEESKNEEGKTRLNSNFFQCRTLVKSSENINWKENFLKTELFHPKDASSSKDSLILDLSKTLHSAKSIPTKKFEFYSKSFGNFPKEKINNRPEIDSAHDQVKISLTSARSLKLEEVKVFSSGQQHERTTFSSRTKSSASEDSLSKQSTGSSTVSYSSPENLEDRKFTTPRSSCCQKIISIDNNENCSPKCRPPKMTKADLSYKLKASENFQIDSIKFLSKFSPTKSKKEFIKDLSSENVERICCSSSVPSNRSRESPTSDEKSLLNFEKSHSGFRSKITPSENSTCEKLSPETLGTEVVTRLRKFSTTFGGSSKNISSNLEIANSNSNETLCLKDGSLSEKNGANNLIFKFICKKNEKISESRNSFPIASSLKGSNSPALTEAVSEEILNLNFNESHIHQPQVIFENTFGRFRNSDLTEIEKSKSQIQNDESSSRGNFSKIFSFQKNKGLGNSLKKFKNFKSKNIESFILDKTSFEKINYFNDPLLVGTNNEGIRKSERTSSCESLGNRFRHAIASADARANDGGPSDGDVWEDLIEEFDCFRNSSKAFSSNNFPGFPFRKNFVDESSRWPAKRSKEREEIEEVGEKFCKKRNKTKKHMNYEDQNLLQISEEKSKKKFKSGFDKSPKKEKGKPESIHSSTSEAYYFNSRGKTYFSVGESGDVPSWSFDRTKEEKPKDHGDGNGNNQQNWEIFLKKQPLDNQSNNFPELIKWPKDISTAKVKLILQDGRDSEVLIRSNGLKRSKSDNCINTKEAKLVKSSQLQEKNCRAQTNKEISKVKKRRSTSKGTPNDSSGSSDGKSPSTPHRKSNTLKLKNQEPEEDRGADAVEGIGKPTLEATGKARGSAPFSTQAQKDKTFTTRNSWLLVGTRRQKSNKPKCPFEGFRNGRKSPTSSRTPVTPLDLKGPGCFHNFYKRFIKIFCLTPDSSVTTTD